MFKKASIYLRLTNKNTISTYILTYFFNICKDLLKVGTAPDGGG